MDRFFLDDDGYTKDFKIEAVPGLHPALSGTFRPMLPEARMRLGHLNANDRDGAGIVKRNAEALHKHLVSWTAKLKDGSEAPITTALLSKLHPALLVKLQDHVFGYEPAEAEADAGN